MKTFRQAMRYFAVGALIGSVVGSLIAPTVSRMLHVRAAAMCGCGELAEKIITTFWAVQGGGLLTGGICGLVLYVTLRRRGKISAPI